MELIDPHHLEETEATQFEVFPQSLAVREWQILGKDFNHPCTSMVEQESGMDDERDHPEND